MKKTGLYISFVAAALAVISCNKEQVRSSDTPSGNIVRICGGISPQIEGEDGTKITFSEADNLKLQSGDKLRLLIGHYYVNTAGTKGTAYKNIELPIESVSDGTFTFDGKVDLGTYTYDDVTYNFTEEDIHGAWVCRGSQDANSAKCERYSSQCALRFACGATSQTQSASGTTTNNGRLMLWTHIPASMVSKVGDRIVISPLTLKLNNAIWIWKVYGEGITDEKLASVKVESSIATLDANNNMANALAARIYKRATDGAQLLSRYNQYAYSTVSLSTKPAVATAKSAASILYQSVFPLATAYKCTKLTVTTDKATYVKEYTEDAPLELKRVASNAYPRYLNIGDGTWTRTEL